MSNELLDELERRANAGLAFRTGVALELIERVRTLQRRHEDALIHYRIGEECTWGDVYVDWGYVAERMARALEPADDPAGERGGGDRDGNDRESARV